MSIIQPFPQLPYRARIQLLPTCRAFNMHKQTRHFRKQVITRRTLEAQLPVARTIQILSIEKVLAYRVISDVFGPLEAHCCGLADVVEGDLRGTGVGFEMEDHAAVGGEGAVTAETGVDWCAVSEAVLWFISDLAVRIRWYVVTRTCTKLDGVSKWRSQSLHTLFSSRCRRYPSRSKCHIFPVQWHPVQTNEHPICLQCCVRSCQLSCL
jgi:hypothetical protein